MSRTAAPHRVRRVTFQLATHTEPAARDLAARLRQAVQGWLPAALDKALAGLDTEGTDLELDRVVVDLGALDADGLVPARLSSALRYAIDETWAGIKLIGIGFKLLASGRVSLRSLGGPIMIGQLAGQAGQQGVDAFFWIMALISLNLGLLNLLPIPVLDGGQIVFGLNGVNKFITSDIGDIFFKFERMFII